MTDKIVPHIAVRPVFDSTTGVYYEAGQEVPVRQSLLDEDAPREVEASAKGGLVKPGADVLKEVRKAASALPAGYDRRGTIQAQPGPQADHRVPAAPLTVAQIEGDEPITDAAVDVGGPARSKKTDDADKADVLK